MAYSKYGRRNYKRNYKRRARNVPWYNKKYSAADMALSAYKGVKYLKTLVNSELCYIDTTPINGTVNSTPGNIGLITAIAQGDSASSRTGNSVLAKSVTVHGYVAWNATGTQQNMAVWLVKDTQQVGDTTPTWGTIFSGSNVQCFMNRDTGAGRFQIMKKWIFTQDESRDQIVFEYNTIIKNTHIRWNGPAASDIQKNGLYIVAVSNQTVNLPSLQTQVRFNYHDN